MVMEIVELLQHAILQITILQIFILMMVHAYVMLVNQQVHQINAGGQDQVETLTLLSLQVAP